MYYFEIKNCVRYAFTFNTNGRSVAKQNYLILLYPKTTTVPTKATRRIASWASQLNPNTATN